MTIQRRTLMTSLAWAAASSLAPAARALGSGHLSPYDSERQMRAALERWRERSKVRGGERRVQELAGTLSLAQAQVQVQEAAKAVAAPTALAADSITNVQTAGVDEGGIVKRAGDFLIVLRRGRLFTVRIGGDQLQPVGAVDAYAPGIDPQGAWYDELLVSGRQVVVVGYSYARGGTEIGLFELGDDGALRHRATHHLRSFDYYSSRNYASRLIGRTLIFYTPTLLSPWQVEPWQQFPALRRWQGDPDAARFERIVPATRVYRTDDDFEPGEALALHTVTRCELGGDDLRCESTAVLGPAGRVFYVSQGSVYVWTSRWRRGPTAPDPRAEPPRSLSAVFRLPLDGSAPSALKTAGVPLDQMSFLEQDGHLNVLLRASGRGEAMWGSESTAGAMALLRVPLVEFGDGRGSARAEHYQRVPAAVSGAVQNRFVGDWLLWGGVRDDRGTSAWALRYAGGGEAIALSPGHAVERIEALGRDAVLVGSAGADLNFSAVRLTRGDARPAGRHVQPGVAQGETRSQGFFYRAQSDDGGMLGLPVLGGGARRHGVYGGSQGSAAVLFLRNRDLRFTPLGQLSAADAGARDDGCKASCVDWYGNARPIFLGDRVLALMGYEIVEGRIEGVDWRFGRDPDAPAAERLVERRRISFAPNAPWREGRYNPFK